jgi:DNA (cytosine-5)-methyltransferase 1
MQTLIQKKLIRLRTGGLPRVLDLFSGCGGLSLGFHSAGFELKGAVEFDADAAASYGHNFHDGDELHSKARDITRTSPMELAKELGLGPVGEGIDVIIGGPPCQSFARVGRPKLREIDEHPEAFKRDPRSRLYLDYIGYVKAFRPLAVLIENVPDILNHGGQNIAEEMCEGLEAYDYVCRYTLLNSAFYGVPQLRERMFLIAYHRDVCEKIRFPAPTHWAVPPSGYEGSRAVALKLLRGGDLFGSHKYDAQMPATAMLPPAVSVGEAIGDLPPIFARKEMSTGRLRRGAKRFTSIMPYPQTVTPSGYARMMRTWAGFVAGEGVRDQVIRYLPRDYQLFALLKPGDQYPEAHALACKLFEKKLARLRSSGQCLDKRSSVYKELLASIVPPYDVQKFPNKWWKMDRDQPARTLMAHLSKDSYSHIHYDNQQARTISVREAARLQSFPDGFEFLGTMNPAFRQIGNAVPPLMARALAFEISTALRSGEERHRTTVASRSGRSRRSGKRQETAATAA